MEFQALLCSWVILFAAAGALPLLLDGKVLRRAGQLTLVIAGLTLLALQYGSPPDWKLLCASLLFLFVMKGVVLLAKPRAKARRTPAISYIVYFSIWPGMEIERLQMRQKVETADVAGFGRGLAFLYLGGGLVLIDAILRPHFVDWLAAWLCAVGLILAIHFGISEVLTALLRLLGIPVERLFKRPELSETLEDFWGRRWNIPFVEMDRRLFLRAFVRRLGPQGAMIGAFAVSGLLHEMALSYPAGGGWGLPLAYFLTNAIGVLVQKRLRITSRIWTWAFVLLPLPLLFHGPFMHATILPFVDWLHRLVAAHPTRWYMNTLLWGLGVAQLLPLAASFQVPSRLGWREELPRLSPFNQKLMWTYGVFVVLTILGFSLLTLGLHSELLGGGRASIALLLFMDVYWMVRLGVDSFYFRRDDWPEGAQFVIGHGLLNSLFLFLVIGYSAVAAWHSF